MPLGSDMVISREATLSINVELVPTIGVELLSVAVIANWKLPGVVGVPVISPLELMANAGLPAGKVDPGLSDQV